MQGSTLSSPSQEDLSIASDDISFADDPEFVSSGCGYHSFISGFVRDVMSRVFRFGACF